MDNNIIYANSAALSYSLYELRLVFSQDSPYNDSDKKEPVQVADIRISPQLAKVLRDILTKGIHDYEEKVGEIPAIKVSSEEQ